MASHWNGFKGVAKKIEDIDLPRIGMEIGVGEDELHAFMDTEASGSGFDNLGRPKMLFEPHVFFRNLKGAKRERAVKAGLAYKEWRPGQYPRDSYPRLIRAMAVDETAALKAASWGLAQVLGENYAMAGYESVQDMVRDFMEDEDNHLEAAVRFIVAAKLDDDLRALARLTRDTTPDDCRSFVRGYNGPRYERNNYHVKFAKAHNKWRKIKDTPYTAPSGVPKQSKPSKPSVTTAKPAAPLNRDLIEKVQQRLRDLGYFEVGNVDGVMGDRTKGAVSTFQGDRKLPLTGDLDQRTLDILMDVRTEKRVVSDERATATAKDLKDAPAVKAGGWLQKLGTGLLVTFGLGGIGDGALNLDAISTGIGKFKSLTNSFLSLSPWVLGAIGGGVVLYFGTKIVREQVKAYREGRHV